MKIKRLLRRTGCGCLIALWFLLLLTPCAVIYLVTQKEIVLPHSDIPNDDFRIWLVESPLDRGIGISNSQRVTTKDGLTCTVIYGHFFLWKGQTDSSSAHYCSCYQQTSGDWSSVAEGDQACLLAGQ